MSRNQDKLATPEFSRGNKGCAGIDNLQVGDLKAYLAIHWLDIKQSILDGTYRPQPVKGVEIDKPKGGKRLLGIPTMIDRLIQQAIQQILDDQFDHTFSGYSFGFTKGRNALQAVQLALNFANSGSRYVVDIDLSKFFDRVNHDYLMSLLSKSIEDKRLLSLICRYVQSCIYRMRNQQFGLKVIEANWQKFVRQCKRITKKSRPFSFEERIRILKSLCFGWISYFRYANIKSRLIGLDRLLGSRLRYCIWKSWKRIRTRIRNLIKLGLPEWLAVKWGFIRRGGWHVVQSPILQTTLTNERLQLMGFVPTYDIYKRFSHV